MKKKIKNFENFGGGRHTHAETRGGSPESAVHAADGGLGDVASADEVVVNVRLPAHDFLSSFVRATESDNLPHQRVPSRKEVRTSEGK